MCAKICPVGKRNATKRRIKSAEFFSAVPSCVLVQPIRQPTEHLAVIRIGEGSPKMEGPYFLELPGKGTLFPRQTDHSTVGSERDAAPSMKASPEVRCL